MAHIKVSLDDDMSKIAELAGVDINNPSMMRKTLYDGKHFFINISGIKQADLDAAYETYKSDLNTHLGDARNHRSERIATKAFDFIQLRYPAHKQQFFQALFTEAIALGLTNRTAYIQELLDWCKSVVGYTNALDDELVNIVSAKDIDEFSSDFSSFEDTDPQITIKGALAIED
jgi:hypothetical protein